MFKEQSPAHRNTVIRSWLMTRTVKVNYVKSAGQPNTVGPVGEPYWWWKHRHGDRQESITEPTRAQLTQSPFWRGIVELEDDWVWDFMNIPVQVERYVDRLSHLLLINKDDEDLIPENLASDPIIKHHMADRKARITRWVIAAEAAAKLPTEEALETLNGLSFDAV